MILKVAFVFALIALMSCIVSGVNVNIDITKLHTTVNEKFISMAIDSGIVQKHWENFRPNSTSVRTLAAGLAPSYMRVGGTGADFLTFVNDKLPAKRSHKDAVFTKVQQELEARNAGSHVEEMEIKGRKKRDVGYSASPLTNFTMTASFYDQIHEFVSSAGWDLIFDLNSLLRKPSNAWDPTNAIELINYTVQSGYKMGGWELGNGLFCCTLFRFNSPEHKLSYCDHSSVCPSTLKTTSPPKPLGQYHPNFMGMIIATSRSLSKISKTFLQMSIKKCHLNAPEQ